MFETIINLKPKEKWRPVMIESLTAEMDRALQFPGVSNAWTMPIKSRIDMLSTGIRTPVGVKVIGTDLFEIDKLAKQIEQVLKTVPGTSSAYAERALGGYYLDVTPDRAALARYGIMVQDVQDVIATALGGQTVTTTVEGHQRFSVNMRYPRDLRAMPRPSPTMFLVPMPNGGAAPWRGCEGHPARPDIDPHRERAARSSIYVDIRDRDLGGYVADAQAAVKASIKFPAGSYVVWSGQFEYLERAAACVDRVPVTLLIIFLLLYLNFRLRHTMIVMLSLPFALVGGSGDVVVGFIFRWRSSSASSRSPASPPRPEWSCSSTSIMPLRKSEPGAIPKAASYPARTDDAIMVGAVERVRPKMMTVVAIMGAAADHVDAPARRSCSGSPCR